MDMTRKAARQSILAALMMTFLASAQADEGKEFAWMERGKDAVRGLLKDPGSAEFREVYFHRGDEGIPMVCGQVNSKNGFGGYVGYQYFISAGNPVLTFLQNHESDFRNVWDRFCR